MAVPLRTLTLYVPTLVRARRVRPLDLSAGVESAFSGCSEADDTLMVSPILEGGVAEEHCAFEDASMVIELRTESEDEARVISGATARGVALILSKIVENMAV